MEETVMQEANRRVVQVRVALVGAVVQGDQSSFKLTPSMSVRTAESPRMAAMEELAQMAPKTE
jgi:hypothetical protein